MQWVKPQHTMSEFYIEIPVEVLDGPLLTQLPVSQVWEGGGTGSGPWVPAAPAESPHGVPTTWLCSGPLPVIAAIWE